MPAQNVNESAYSPQLTVNFYRSVEELCADKNLELIVVNTPTHLHFEQAKQVLLAGKNIIIEKPFAITVNEAEEPLALPVKLAVSDPSPVAQLIFALFVGIVATGALLVDPINI